ncbi:c-type cytochrome [Cohnella cholangitidis]|uniref:Cytochrome c n=1 Tax=Cohnella cholangitidis TaxID=2598458 RepID=A0A7G5BS39_9BACL|nr:cytochrome c [Cohnella cholangitidis]QMV39773.1 cytochrome c [Cohnella cholangitidis]
MQKRIMATLLIIACVFGVYLLSSGLPDKKESEVSGTKFTVPERAVNAAASEQLYQNMCISCHGDQLQGSVGPELAHIGDSMTIEQIFKKISGGGGGMPAFEDRLTEDQLITITTWLASKK